MRKIDSAVESVKKFVSEKGKFTCIIDSILIFLFASALIVSIVQFCRRPRKVKSFKAIEPMISTKELLPPTSKLTSNDYYFSRIPSDKWSDDEITRWFTEPSENKIDELGAANDALVSDIIGAAP